MIKNGRAAPRKTVADALTQVRHICRMTLLVSLRLWPTYTEFAMSCLSRRQALLALLVSGSLTLSATAGAAPVPL